MNDVLGLMISLIIPTLIGCLVYFYLSRPARPNLVCMLAFGFGLGFGFLAQCMFILGALGIRYSRLSIIYALGVLAVYVLILSFVKLRAVRGCLDESAYISVFKKKELSPTARPSRSDILWIVFVGTIILTYIFYLFRAALDIPVYTWDSIATCVYSAKVLYYQESLVNLNLLPHSSYPLQVPLSLTWISMNLGGWNDQLIKIFFPFVFLSFFAIFYQLLFLLTDRRWAWLGALLLFSSNLLLFHATIAYRDLVLMYFNCGTVLLLVIWQIKRADFLLSLAALFAGFATFTKLEGNAYLGIYFFLLLVILWRSKQLSWTKKMICFIRFLVPCGCIFALFVLYKWIMGVPFGEYIVIDFTNLGFRILVVFKAFVRQLFLNMNWNIIWFVLMLSLVFNYQKIKKDISVQLVMLALVMFLGLHFTLSVVSQEGWKIISAEGLARIFIHFFPLAPFCIVLLNFPEEERFL